MKFKYTIIFALIALVLSIILFFNSSSILSYLIYNLILFIIIVLMGYTIDCILRKKIIFGIISIILILFFIISFFVIYKAHIPTPKFSNHLKISCIDSNGTIISFNEECSENYYYSAAAYHDVQPGYKCCLPE